MPFTVPSLDSWKKNRRLNKELKMIQSAKPTFKKIGWATFSPEDIVYFTDDAVSEQRFKVNVYLKHGGHFRLYDSHARDFVAFWNDYANVT
jgi:hypothetical protein